jgi:SAM-dependent methyltransferase
VAAHANRTQLAMSFGAIAENYDRLRSAPPPDAVEWMLPQRRDLVVDLGAGTGLLSRQLASRARRVIAVEPDDRMRAVLAARSPGVEAVAGVGEAIPLPDDCADAVLVSSAWHWMDPDLAVPEIARVLHEHGRFCVLWNGRDHAVEWLRADLWFREAEAERDQAEQEPVTGRMAGRREISLPQPGEFENIETATFRFIRTMSAPELVGMLATYSRIITASPQARQAGRERATAALARLFPPGAEIEVPMRSHCWRADLAARPRH